MARAERLQLPKVWSFSYNYVFVFLNTVVDDCNEIDKKINIV